MAKTTLTNKKPIGNPRIKTKFLINKKLIGYP